MQRQRHDGFWALKWQEEVEVVNRRKVGRYQNYMEMNILILSLYLTLNCTHINCVHVLHLDGIIISVGGQRQMPMRARKNDTYLTLSLFGSDWILWLKDQHHTFFNVWPRNLVYSSDVDDVALFMLITCHKCLWTWSLLINVKPLLFIK